MAEHNLHDQVINEIVENLISFRRPADLNVILGILDMVRAEIIFLHSTRPAKFRDDVQKGRCPFNGSRLR